MLTNQKFQESGRVVDSFHMTAVQRVRGCNLEPIDTIGGNREGDVGTRKRRARVAQKRM